MLQTLQQSKNAHKCGRAVSLICYARNVTSQACIKYSEVTHPEDESHIPPSVRLKLERFSKYTLNTYARPSFIMTHGKGSWIYTTSTNPTSAESEGVSSSKPYAPPRKYLDFTAGIAVNALGHADNELASIMHEQASTLVHASNIYHNEWAGELAELLVTLTQRDGGLGWAPGSSSPQDGGKVFFANSGTEANEGALKFARKVGKERWTTSYPNASIADCPKTAIVCFENGFHGRSMGALSVTTNPKYQAPFSPLIPNIRVGALNDTTNFSTLIDEDACAVIVEPVQGEGGVRASHESFLRAIRKRCNEVGAVLIYDEIQCGLYRSGSLWAHSSLPTDCHPDIVTMAKPLANGYPIGAILVRDTIAESITIGSHGTTFGGSVLATRLGHNVLSRISQPEFIRSMRAVSAHLRYRLKLLPGLFPEILQPEIRGSGFILGLPFKNSADPGKLVKFARERGVLLLTAGSDAVRLVPSLNVSKEEVDFAVDVIESSLVLL